MHTKPIAQTRMEAALSGHVRYLGGPCKACGSSVRYTCNGRCVACNNRDSNKQHKVIGEALKAAKSNNE